ncbi:hypothetical protein LTR05_002441 [Lithohypha guttulata]|uniref:Transmembrane protein 53 n=1 Tax=Lithohypha guttulata TaxID=1690604 RepID=A0AAN7T3C2_9EURO|nr:hypothetical protein LTR05_002441 [Lithohypha guttulata]
MESSTTTVTPNVLTGLGFSPLSRGISLYKPADELRTSGDEKSPTLIVICSWAFAQPKHIAKYVQPYQELYPSATILLIQNIIANTIWVPDSWQMSFFQPAARAIQLHLSASPKPRVLLHAFSNGGAHAAVQLAQACLETCGGMRLPVDALVLDSCPGQPRAVISVNALVQGVPSNNLFIKSAARALAYAAVGATAVVDILNLSEHALWKLYRKLNDANDVFLCRSTNSEEAAHIRPIPRTYIYSESDLMILAVDVVGHARVAKEKLLAMDIEKNLIEESVKMEEFVGTEHVNHVKSEREGYWGTVQTTWAKAVQSSLP